MILSDFCFLTACVVRASGARSAIFITSPRSLARLSESRFFFAAVPAGTGVTGTGANTGIHSQGTTGTGTGTGTGATTGTQGQGARGTGTDAGYYQKETRGTTGTTGTGSGAGAVQPPLQTYALHHTSAAAVSDLCLHLALRSRMVCVEALTPHFMLQGLLAPLAQAPLAQAQASRALPPRRQPLSCQVGLCLSPRINLPCRSCLGAPKSESCANAAVQHAGCTAAAAQQLCPPALCTARPALRCSTLALQAP